ncbi:GAF and ANTAR domain-containing protein [Cellulosimicrobium sp. CUA-896]|uniref:GAF and ANTAR domain-containing protein n=1 Tax=Cellulosimicrobium sp. CUA-896 TaxID=1517881 RepID=UPI002101B88D|nr:GAF and ANTAR domain-containing protein [Cellulosimicrobium sp. CUA-896]
MRTSTQALAASTSALLRGDDVTDLLARLLADAVAFLPVDGAAVLVAGPYGALELLSATSHREQQLELYQAQVDEGPCVDTVRDVAEVVCVGADEIVGRWPTVGVAVVGSGFSAVHAFPLRWHDGALGGLNLFGTDASSFSPEECALAQSFADVATLAVVHPTALADDEVRRRVEQALEGRAVVERAKGVLAHQLGVDPGDAYDELVARARGGSLTATAEAVVAEASRRR